MAQTAVYMNHQSESDEPAHLISRSMALSFLADGHADRQGAAIRLRAGRSLQSLKAEYRERPKVKKSAWIPEVLPPAEVQGLVCICLPNPNEMQTLYEIGEHSVQVSRRSLVVMAREFCNQVRAEA